jgi:predicted DNA-binding protein (UPF0251 family)
MARPKKNRIVGFSPEVSYFKPRGIPLMDLEEVKLTIDEREAIRLADLLGLSYEEAGSEMGISRATFGRIVQRARGIIADALINGKAINVEGGNYTFVDSPRKFICNECEREWEEPCGTGRPDGCPACKSMQFRRILEPVE